ncbi:uncharacterized protein ACA1_324880 [Acanthamoeba castellanii str. Neff]|uniref:Uncharacterized protein n=1 Tax=Acanthamoeba castellanii (strain ATCC 30010 / Neff) TaxID=1257118 RepID=L8GJS8_ACACF|nr:uncharacterized protein ACA1_324880 [Acanthamoeba castellanii str. Neff]ELR12441.1 hypothetical protein ACA1_324880 [Acanthamoeba castellanii str. Neff]
MYDAQWLAGGQHDDIETEDNADSESVFFMAMPNPAADNDDSNGDETSRRQPVARLVGMNQEDIMQLPPEELAGLALGLDADQSDDSDRRYGPYGDDYASRTDLSFVMASPSILVAAPDDARDLSVSPEQSAKRVRRSGSPLWGSSPPTYASNMGFPSGGFGKANEDETDDQGSQDFYTSNVPATDLNDAETIELKALGYEDDDDGGQAAFDGPFAFGAAATKSWRNNLQRADDPEYLSRILREPNSPWQW